MAEPDEGLTLVELWWHEAYYSREPEPTAWQLAMLIAIAKKGEWLKFMPPEFRNYDAEAEADARLNREHQRTLARQLDELLKMYMGRKS